MTTDMQLMGMETISVISESDMATSVMGRMFDAANLTYQLVEELPAVPVWNLPAAERFDVSYKCDDINEVVHVWIDFKSRLVRMQVVVFKNKEFKVIGLDVAELKDQAQHYNQAANFGTVSLENPFGVTLEYALPYHGGLFREALVFAVKRMAAGAAFMRELCTP